MYVDIYYLRIFTLIYLLIQFFYLNDSKQKSHVAEFFRRQEVQRSSQLIDKQKDWCVSNSRQDTDLEQRIDSHEDCELQGYIQGQSRRLWRIVEQFAFYDLVSSNEDLLLTIAYISRIQVA